MAERYFTTDIQGDTARISGADAAHLARVLRARAGDVLTLCDGARTDYTAEILQVGKDAVTLRVLDSSPSRGEPDLWAEAYIGFAKGERMDYAVQKAVELGASVIVPFFSERCVVRPGDGHKAQRFARIAAEAAKQCGRGILPAVGPPVGYDEMLATAAQNEQALFLYELGGRALREAYTGARRVALITGPEGGFTPAEADRALAVGCVPIGLGPRILRSETAPAAGLAVLMALSGNLE